MKHMKPQTTLLIVNNAYHQDLTAQELRRDLLDVVERIMAVASGLTPDQAFVVNIETQRIPLDKEGV